MIFTFLTSVFYGEENIANYKIMSNSKATLGSSCEPSSSQTDLDVNNVRARILGGGDMWWNLIDAKYEIPKGSGKHSMFAGALWIGGVDEGDAIKVAAQTYRQSGNDFWPGPLTNKTTVEKEDCKKYDRHWKITRTQVEELISYRNGEISSYTMPKDIKEWPGNGDVDKGEMYYLAPYYSKSGDDYNEAKTDAFPAYAIQSVGNVGYLYGDMTIWWVYNDKGDIHTASGGEPIGLEIRAQAFGFATSDAINNMTFYDYEVINRSAYKLNKAYFGQWVDADLGYAFDDYVGCDVGRGLGYCYNGDAEDEGVTGYGLNPPAVGVDFFRGPLADATDGVDNNRNGITDEDKEDILMSKFVYYNNDWSQFGNPSRASDYYNYLKGVWKDGTSMTYGGNGFHSGGVECDFMFPGNSDPQGWGTGGQPQAIWDEASSGNVPADRRFLMSAGPFTLEPGAVNYITTGVVWASTGQGGPQGSIELLKTYDDYAQALFDAKFEMMNGPIMPNVQIIEEDKEIIINIIDTKLTETYLDTTKGMILYQNSLGNNITTIDDIIYKFQGYIIYQLEDYTINSSDLYNSDKARIIAQVDIKDGITEIINADYDPVVNKLAYKEMVNGEDKGVKHSFSVKTDLFAKGNSELINHKKYVYMVVPYSYGVPDSTELYDKFEINQAFLSTRVLPKYVAVPHNRQPEKYGSSKKSEYGTGVIVKRLEGNGNGGNEIRLSESTINSIIANGKAEVLEYERGYGPINVKVVDPLSVPGGDFIVKFDTVTVYDDTLKVLSYNWSITNSLTGETVNSETATRFENEQIITNWGLSININDVDEIEDLSEDGYGFIKANIGLTDNSKPWLTFIPDYDLSTEGSHHYFDWILSGNTIGHDWTTKGTHVTKGSKDPLLDPNEVWESVLGGTWAPFKLTAYFASTEYNNPAKPPYVAYPGYSTSSAAHTSSKLNNLSSVQIVLTADKAKWTRCVVVEMCEESALSIGNARKGQTRRSQSVNKEGSPDGTGTGMGWFPGYAISLETGERLNIAFGEDSYLSSENGDDMIWNPTNNVTNSTGQLLFGGKHYIYVFGHKGDNVTQDCPAYDEGVWLYSMLSWDPPQIKNTRAWSNCMWVSMPIVNQKYLFNDPASIPTDITISINVSKPYKRYLYTSIGSTAGQNDNYPMYSFNTDDIKALTNNVESADSALDLINVVPNPYYAYSGYEVNQLDNRVKIINLPTKCTVKIYTLNGILIREYNVDKSGYSTDRKFTSSSDLTDFQVTSIDWDLKNTFGVPILGGVYLIHVKVPNVGEKVIKWFGVTRPVDLDSF